jgi:hypothetical protein
MGCKSSGMMRIVLIILASSQFVWAADTPSAVVQVCQLEAIHGKSGYVFTGTLIQKGSYLLTVSHPFVFGFDKLLVNCSGEKRVVTTDQVIVHPNSKKATPKEGYFESRILTDLGPEDAIVESEIGDLALVKLSTPINSGKNSVSLATSEEEIIRVAQTSQCFGYGYGPDESVKPPMAKKPVSFVQRQIDLHIGNRMTVDGKKGFLSDANHFFIFPTDTIRPGDSGGPILCGSQNGDLVLIGIIRGVQVLNVHTTPISLETFPLPFGSVENFLASADWINQSCMTEHASKIDATLTKK